MDEKMYQSCNLISVNLFVVRFDGAPSKQVRVKRLRGCHSVCERNGKINDDTIAKPAFTVVTYNTYPEDLKINLNVTKIKSEDHDARSVSAAIVCDRDFLQSLVAVGEVNAGRDARFQYKETDFRGGAIEKR